MPAEVADGLLQEASPWWLGGASAQVLADDLALCHPSLADGEVRTQARPSFDPSVYRLTVVSRAHPGLLAAVAAAMAAEGLLVVKAVATSWATDQLTLIGVNVMHPDDPLQPAEWERVSTAVRQAAAIGSGPPVTFTPRPPVTVDVFPREEGQARIEVRAPHRVGLLWAICSWLNQNDCSVDAAFVEASGGIRQSLFAVQGTVDAAALRRHLAGRPTWRSPSSLFADTQRRIRRRYRLP